MNFHNIRVKRNIYMCAAVLVNKHYGMVDRNPSEKDLTSGQQYEETVGHTERPLKVVCPKVKMTFRYVTVIQK